MAEGARCVCLSDTQAPRATHLYARARRVRHAPAAVTPSEKIVWHILSLRNLLLVMDHGGAGVLLNDRPLRYWGLEFLADPYIGPNRALGKQDSPRLYFF